MNQSVNAGRSPAEMSANRGLSQAMFVVVGLGIILGGLWTLYMADAPYHPDANSEISLAAD